MSWDTQCGVGSGCKKEIQFVIYSQTCLWWSFKIRQKEGLKTGGSLMEV